MAVTAIWSVKGSVGKVLRYVANPAKTWNGQYAEAAKFHTVERVLEYDADAMKTEKQFYVTSINCSDSPASAAEQFRATKETWKKPGGIVCFHGYQSFEAGEVTPDIAHEIGVKLAKQLWGDRFQVVVSTHTNTGKIHNHFCLNSVSFTDGKRYYDQKATYYKMREVSDDLCEDYGLSVIEHPGRGSKQYKAWLGDKDGTSRRDAVRTDIDAVLEYAASFRQFQIEIQNRGYILEYRGSFLRIRPDEGKKFFRLDRLGDGYSEDEIRERCRCNYENRPRPVRVAFVYQKRERATGIVGLYRHYAYLLKHFPHEVRPFDRTAYAAMRDDARKMKRYSEEAKLLTANDIVTAEDLQHFTESIGTRFKALAYERAKQRNRLRRMHDSTAMQPTKEIIYDLSAQMAELRRQMKLCEDIAERCGVIEMVVNEIERGQIAEKRNLRKRKNAKKGLTFDSICAIIIMERMKQPGEEKNMYSIEFYEKENGESDVWDFLEELREKAATNKDARIQYRQITLYIELLQNNGTRQPDNITKHIEENIWELRPGNNRVFYFYYENNTFVLLHHFRKKTQKTPQREIEQAKAERNDYLRRKEAVKK